MDFSHNSIFYQYFYLECSVTLDQACGNRLVTKGDAVEMMHVGVHVVYCCLRLQQEMRTSQ